MSEAVIVRRVRRAERTFSRSLRDWVANPWG